jgi:hypothetical protein
MKLRHALSAAVCGVVLVALAGCGTDNPLTGGTALDSTPPSSPTNVLAEQRSSDLVLTWDASSDADVQGCVYRAAPDRRARRVRQGERVARDGHQFPVADATAALAWYRIKAVGIRRERSAASSAVQGARPVYIGGADDTPIEQGVLKPTHRP